MNGANFITSLAWVQQGKAKPRVEKLKYTKEELAGVIKELKLKEAEFESRPESERKTAQEPVTDSENERDSLDTYDLNNYDNETNEAMSNQPIETLIMNNEPDSDSEDSDAEPDEFTVKPDDNLILAGHVNNDVCMLEVYVFNNEKAELFLLHDVFLPSQPMCIEWVDFNPKNKEISDSLAVVGYMDPEIHMWDLGVSDCLEPAFRLGGNRVKRSQRHLESVLSLSWNRQNRSVIASGSADKTVRVWDLNNCASVLKLDPFQSYVQSVEWHNIEAQTLLTGCADNKVRLFDCRGTDLCKDWTFEGEIEQIMWNPFNPMIYFATTGKGEISCLDLRSRIPVWSIHAHNEEAVMALSSHCESFLVTASQDSSVKVWDISNSVPKQVAQKSMNIGAIYSLRSCPDVPYVFCAGGTNKDNHLYVWDSRDTDAVVDHFGDKSASGGWKSRQKSKPRALDIKTEEMDTINEIEPCSSSSLAVPSADGQIKLSKKKPNKGLNAVRNDARDEPQAGTSSEGNPKKKQDHKKMHPKSKRKDKEH